VHSHTALEELVDEAILALTHLDDLWVDPQFVANLYDHDTYYQNVILVYKKINHLFWYHIPDHYIDEEQELGKPDPLHTKYVFFNVLKRHNARTYYHGFVEFTHHKHMAHHTDEEEEKKEHEQQQQHEQYHNLQEAQQHSHDHKTSDFTPEEIEILRTEAASLLEEWSLQYDYQQIFFWSFILAVAATMKYIHLQLREQMVFVPVQHTIKNTAVHKEENMSTSLKKRFQKNKSLIHGEEEHHEHKSADEYDSFLDGFVLAPPNTGDISHSELQKTKDKKEDSQALHIGIFTKRKYLDRNPHQQTPEKFYECYHEQHDYIDPEQYYEWQYLRVCSQCLNSMQLSECVWKYVLLFEHPEYEGDLWPWYQNCAYINDQQYAISYEEKLKITVQNAAHRITGLKFKEVDKDHKEEKKEEHHNLLVRTLTHMPFWHRKHHHEIVMETISHENIRQYRKFTAKFMLGYWEIAKNIEIVNSTLRTQSEEYHKKNLQQNKSYQIEKQDGDEDDNNKPLIKSVFSEVWEYWMTILKQTLNSINKTEDNKHFDVGYIEFKKFYRLVPSWWHDEHDRLLLELALKFQLNVEDYKNELSAEGKEKLYNEKNYPKFKQFCAWCTRKVNAEHRLRYLLYVLVKSEIINLLPDQPYSPHSETEIGCHGIFLYDYMKDYHIAITQDRAKHHKVAKKTLAFETAKEEEALKNIVSNAMKKKNTSEISLLKKYEEDEIHVQNVRDLHIELLDVLQTYDLHKYGHTLCVQIIFEITRKQRDALLEVLGLILREMPTLQALEVLQEFSAELCHSDPIKIYRICVQIMRGANFVAATAICLANFLKDFGKYDLARSEEWDEYSEKLEEVAITKMTEIENEYLAALMMLMPTNVTRQHDTLYKIVLDNRRTAFTNNERINGVIQHMYGNFCFLNPKFCAGEEITAAQKASLDADYELTLMMQSPALYYYSPLGLERTQKISFILYLLYVAYIIISLEYPYRPVTLSEWIMWGLNAGFVIYEALEIYEMRAAYLDSINRSANLLSLLFCVNWIFIFLVRVFPQIFDHHWHETVDEYRSGGDAAGLRNTSVVQAYMILFAFQCLLIMQNGLNLFRTHPFFGIFLRIIILMFQDMVKFAFLLGSFFLGFYFAMYIVVATDLETVFTVTGSSNYNLFERIRGLALFMYQTLLGQQNWGDLVKIHGFSAGRSEIILILICVFAMFGVILLLNLLIAVLMKSFNDVTDVASAESAFTRAHRTYTLIYRTKTLPPPFNIVVYVIYGGLSVVHLILYYPSEFWRKYCCVMQDYDLFSIIYTLNPLMYALFNRHELLTLHEKHCKDRRFCPFCYNEFKDSDELTIDNFLEAEAVKELQIDPADRQYAKRISLYSNSYYCSKCYRPFQHMHELLTKSEVVLDIVSFYIWIIGGLPFIFLVIVGPASLIRFKRYLLESEDDEEEQHSHGVRRLHLHDDELVEEEVPEKIEFSDDDE